jgi:hypothetical protein
MPHRSRNSRATLPDSPRAMPISRRSLMLDDNDSSQQRFVAWLTVVTFILAVALALLLG